MPPGESDQSLEQRLQATALRPVHEYQVHGDQCMSIPSAWGPMHEHTKCMGTNA